MAWISWPGTGSWVWLVSLLLPQALTEHLSAKSWERPWERPRNAKKEGCAGQPGGSVPTKSGLHRGGMSPLWSRKRAENTLSWGGDTPVCSLRTRSVRRHQCLPTMTHTTPAAHIPEKPRLVLHLIFFQDPPPFSLQLFNPLLLYFGLF